MCGYHDDITMTPLDSHLGGHMFGTDRSPGNADMIGALKQNGWVGPKHSAPTALRFTPDSQKKPCPSALSDTVMTKAVMARKVKALDPPRFFSGEQPM